MIGVNLKKFQKKKRPCAGQKISVQTVVKIAKALDVSKDLIKNRKTKVLDTMKVTFGLLLILSSGMLSIAASNEPAGNTAKPDIDWGIGVYPSRGFTNSNTNDWENAFKMAKIHL